MVRLQKRKLQGNMLAVFQYLKGFCVEDSQNCFIEFFRIRRQGMKWWLLHYKEVGFSWLSGRLWEMVDYLSPEVFKQRLDGHLLGCCNSRFLYCAVGWTRWSLPAIILFYEIYAFMVLIIMHPQVNEFGDLAQWASVSICSTANQNQLSNFRHNFYARSVNGIKYLMC